MSEEFKKNNNNKHYELGESFFDPLFDAFIGMPIETKKGNRLMKTDIEEKNDKFILNIEMPGIKKENIKVSLNDGTLKVSYKQVENSNTNDEHHYIRKERFYSEGERSFYLGDVDNSKVDAHLDSGVLTIAVPKAVKVDNTHYIDVK